MRVQIPPSAQIEDNMEKIKLIIVCIFFSLLLTQEEATDCSVSQELYNNNNISEAYFEINKLTDLSEECKYLAFNILFKMESFDEAKIYLDQLLRWQWGLGPPQLVRQPKSA